MRWLVPAMLVLGLLAVGCAASPVPSVVLRISRPQSITWPMGSGTNANPSEGLWVQGVFRSAGAGCAKRNPPGFHYVVSDRSDAGVTMAITCEADGSKCRVRVIFVPESG
jgi:hypothetical protein